MEKFQFLEGLDVEANADLIALVRAVLRGDTEGYLALLESCDPLPVLNAATAQLAILLTLQAEELGVSLRELSDELAAMLQRAAGLPSRPVLPDSDQAPAASTVWFAALDFDGVPDDPSCGEVGA